MILLPAILGMVFIMASYFFEPADHINYDTANSIYNIGAVLVGGNFILLALVLAIGGGKK